MKLIFQGTFDFAELCLVCHVGSPTQRELMLYFPEFPQETKDLQVVIFNVFCENCVERCDIMQLILKLKDFPATVTLRRL